MENRIREILAAHNPEKAQCLDGYWVCPACGYDYGVFPPGAVEDELDEFNHVSSLLAELVTEYQAKAWDKGWAKGVHASGISPKRLSYVYPPTKSNKNPYRAQLEHHNGRR